MQVKELKELLDKYPDDMEVVMYKTGYYKSVTLTVYTPLENNSRYDGYWNYNCNSNTTCLVLE